MTLAIDLATRTVPAFFVGLERPSAATVALLVSRIAQPKQDFRISWRWLADFADFNSDQRRQLQH